MKRVREIIVPGEEDLIGAEDGEELSGAGLGSVFCGNDAESVEDSFSFTESFEALILP